MSRTRICTGELVGCQPTWQNLEDIWDMTLRGVDDNQRSVSLTHIIGGREIVRVETLEKLKADAGDPPFYDNFTMQVSQVSPLLEIEIKIGPGRITAVSVEAEDHTWAIGRHTEIMENFVKTRKRYALGSSYVPQWPKRRLITIGGIVSTIFYSLLSFASFAALAVVMLFLLTYLVGVPYAVVDNIAHHAPVTHRQIVELIFDLTLAALIVSAIFQVAAASRSRVVVHVRPFWTVNRSSSVSTVAAAVSAIAAIIALFVT